MARKDLNKPPTKHVLIEIAKDEKNIWRWILWSSNGIAMATDVGGYTRRADAIAAAKTLVRIAQTAKYIVETIREVKVIDESFEPVIQQAIHTEEEITSSEEAQEGSNQIDPSQQEAVHE